MTRKYLTATREDYIRAIGLLQEKDGSVQTVELARYLKLSKSTVSERLNELMRCGLVVRSHYSPIRLTRRGYKMSQSITHKHRVIEVFLNSVLKVPKSEVHKEANILEHAVSDEVIKKLSHFLGNPKKDPHGVLIPTLQ